MKLVDRVALVTGAASGFGRATAVRLAREGARIVIADLDEKGGRATIETVESVGSAAELVVGDVASLDVARSAVARALERFGRLDVLVNNAGIVQGDPMDTWDAAEESWDRVVRVNLRSVFACSKAAIPALLARGGGSIVNVASIAASVCVGGSAYAATKGAILSYTRHVAAELAPRGVRMNCVSPGFMRTPMSTGERSGLAPAEQEARIAAFGALVPMGRAGGVDDIANAILYLASDESAYVTGQEIIVDGGYVVRPSSGPGPAGARRGA
jgi:NAD(P)-dependent dehydrogenase (short-subunit alcohol dehydrogenase family)